MAKGNIRHKNKSRRSIMKQIRSFNVKRKRDSSSSSSSSSSSNINAQSTVFTKNESTSSVENAEHDLNFFSIIYMKFLLSFVKKFLCSECKSSWNGSVSLKERNGLYIQFEFICSNCASITRLSTSPQMSNTRRQEINVRLALGGALCGLGRNGLVKLLGCLNLPPPVQDEKYRQTQEFILNYIEVAQEQSMANAVEDAVVEAGGSRDLTISGDGAWLTRGHSSVHGIAALGSSTKSPKIIDTNWCSKRCIKCQGAESLRQVDPDLFSVFQKNHECQLNFIGKFL